MVGKIVKLKEASSHEGYNTTRGVVVGPSFVPDADGENDVWNVKWESDGEVYSYSSRYLEEIIPYSTYVGEKFIDWNKIITDTSIEYTVEEMHELAVASGNFSKCAVGQQSHLIQRMDIDDVPDDHPLSMLGLSFCIKFCNMCRDWWDGNNRTLSDHDSSLRELRIIYNNIVAKSNELMDENGDKKRDKWWKKLISWAGL